MQCLKHMDLMKARQTEPPNWMLTSNMRWSSLLLTDIKSHLTASQMPPMDLPYLEGMSSSMPSPTLFLLNIAKVPSEDSPTWKESSLHHLKSLQLKWPRSLPKCLQLGRYPIIIVKVPSKLFPLERNPMIVCKVRSKLAPFERAVMNITWVPFKCPPIGWNPINITKVPSKHPPLGGNPLNNTKVPSKTSHAWKERNGHR